MYPQPLHSAVTHVYIASCLKLRDLSEFQIPISSSCSLLLHQSGNYCHFDQEFLWNNCLFDLRCLKGCLLYSNVALKWAFNIHDFHVKMLLLVDQKVFLTLFKASGVAPANCPLLRATIPLKSQADTVSRGTCIWTENTESYSSLLIALQQVLGRTGTPHEVTSVSWWDCTHFIVSLFWATRNVIAF